MAKTLPTLSFDKELTDKQKSALAEADKQVKAEKLIGGTAPRQARTNNEAEKASERAAIEKAKAKQLAKNAGQAFTERKRTTAKNIVQSAGQKLAGKQAAKTQDSALVNQGRKAVERVTGRAGQKLTDEQIALGLVTKDPALPLNSGAGIIGRQAERKARFEQAAKATELESERQRQAIEAQRQANEEYKRRFVEPVETAKKDADDAAKAYQDALNMWVAASRGGSSKDEVDELWKQAEGWKFYAMTKAQEYSRIHKQAQEEAEAWEEARAEAARQAAARRAKLEYDLEQARMRQAETGRQLAPMLVREAGERLRQTGPETYGFGDYAEMPAARRTADIIRAAAYGNMAGYANAVGMIDPYAEAVSQDEGSILAGKYRVPQMRTAGQAHMQSLARQWDELGRTSLERAKADLSTGGQLAVEIGVAALQMLGDIAITQGRGTLYTMTVRAGGGYAMEAARDGASQNEQFVYGLAGGAVEAATEKIFAVAPLFNKVFGKPIIKTDFANSAIKTLARTAKSPTGRAIVDRTAHGLLAMTSEGAEEVLADFMEPVIRKATYDRDGKISWDLQQMLHDGIIGAALGALGVPSVIARSGQVKSGYELDEALDKYQAAIIEKGILSDEARQASMNVWRMTGKLSTQDVAKAVSERLAVDPEAAAREPGVRYWLAKGRETERTPAETQKVEDEEETEPVMPEAETQRIEDEEAAPAEAAPNEGLSSEFADRIPTETRERQEIPPPVLPGMEIAGLSAESPYPAEPDAISKGDQSPFEEPPGLRRGLETQGAEREEAPAPVLPGAETPESAGRDTGPAQSESGAETVSAGDRLTMYDGHAYTVTEVSPTGISIRNENGTTNTLTWDMFEDMQRAGAVTIERSGENGLLPVRGQSGEPGGRAGGQAEGLRPGGEYGQTAAERVRAADRGRALSTDNGQRAPLVSGREIGLRNGSDTKAARIIPEHRWKDSGHMGVLDEIRAAGYEPIPFTGTVYVETAGRRAAVDGFRFERDGRRYVGVKMDSARLSPRQIARHELAHEEYVRQPLMVRAVWDRLTADGDESFYNLLEDYVQGLNSMYGEELERYMEEIFCDAQAGISRRYAPMNEELRGYISETAGQVRQEYADATEGRGPPEGEAGRAEEYLGGLGVQLGEDSAERYSLETWTKDEQKRVHSALVDAGFNKSTAYRWVRNVNGIAARIAADKERLDYEASPDRSAWVSNSEYGGSVDFSTLCKKRRLLTGTFSAIQRAMPDTALSAVQILDLRSMMQNKGYEVNCGLCYVEGSRAQMGVYAKAFLDKYAKTDPAYLPNMAEANTPDGLEGLRTSKDPGKRAAYEAYEYFMNHGGRLQGETGKGLFSTQAKPKLYQLRTSYKGEIAKAFGGEKHRAAVKEKNRHGGIRVQSFSDFETPHLIDMMQVIMDMSSVGLAGQAYTKVPDFAWVNGNTGLKINLSLIAKDVDSSGGLIFDEVEGMPLADAMALRSKYSKNVGTIVVTFTDAQLRAAMKDSRIDFIIPFHHSQWSKEQFDQMGLPEGTRSYQSYQGEKWAAPAEHNGESRPKEFLQPNDYWDFSKSGRENAETYLRLCAEQGRIPKFATLNQSQNARKAGAWTPLVYDETAYDGKGGYILNPDGSADGYWKTLIDFKMYDNNGKGSPQMPVKPRFNMTEAMRVLNEYEGGANTFPVAHDIVDEFLAKYQNETTGQRLSVSEDEEIPTPKAAGHEAMEQLARERDGERYSVDDYLGDSDELLRQYSKEELQARFDELKKKQTPMQKAKDKGLLNEEQLNEYERLTGELSTYFLALGTLDVEEINRLNNMDEKLQNLAEENRRKAEPRNLQTKAKGTAGRKKRQAAEIVPTPKAEGHEAMEQLARERDGDIARAADEKRAAAAARVSDSTLKNNIREKRRQIQDIENLIGGGEANPGQARKLETLRAELRAMETELKKRTAAKPQKPKSEARAEKPAAKPAPYADPIEDDGKGKGSAAEAVKAAETAEKAERKKDKKKTAKPHRAAAETAKKLVGLFAVEKEDRARAEQLVMDALVRYAQRGRMSTGEVRELVDGLFALGTVEGEARNEEAEDFRRQMRRRRIYVSDELKSEFGDDYDSLRKRAFSAGIYFVNDSTGMAPDMVNHELAGEFPGFFDAGETDMGAVLEKIVSIAEEGQTERLSMEDFLKTLAETNTDYARDYARETEAKVREYLLEFAKNFKLEAAMDKYWAGQLWEQEKRHQRDLKARDRNEEGRARELAREQIIKDRAKRAEQRHAASQWRQEQRERKAVFEAVKRAARLSRKVNLGTLSEMEDALREVDLDRLQAIKPTDRSAEEEAKLEIASARAALAEAIGGIDILSRRLSNQGIENRETLAEDYRKLKEELGDNFISLKGIEERVGQLSKKQIDEMSIDDVRELGKTISSMVTEIENGQKLLSDMREQSLQEAAASARRDIEGTKGFRAKRKHKEVNPVTKLLAEGQLSPGRVMSMIGGWRDSGVWEDFRRIFEEATDREMRFRDEADRLYASFSDESHEDYKERRKWLETSYGRKAKWEKLRVEIYDPDAAVENMEQKKPAPTFVDIEITPMMKVALYLHAQNDDNLNHIAVGGIVIPHKQLMQDGKVRAAYEEGNSQRVRITPLAMKAIARDVKKDKYAYAFAELMHKYTDEVSKDAINGVSLAVEGFERATVKNYWPIESAKDFVGGGPGSWGDYASVESIGSIANERVPRAGNPIMLFDAVETFQRQKDTVAKYAAYTIPLRDWDALMAYNFHRKGGVAFETTMRKLIESKWGAGVNEYFDQLEKDLSFKTAPDKIEFMSKLRGNFASAWLSFNASVALSQAAAYPTALPYIGLDGMASGLKLWNKVDSELIGKYTGVLAYRESTGFSPEAMDFLKTNNAFARLMKKHPQLNWPEQMDTYWIKRLWAACEYRVAKDTDLRPGENPKSGEDPYYRAVADLFRKAVFDTQYNSSTFQRPGVLRRDNEIVKLVTMFKTDAMQHYNMIFEAAGRLGRAQEDYKAAAEEDKDEARKRYRQARENLASNIAAVIGSEVLWSSIKGGFKVLRGSAGAFATGAGAVTVASFAKGVAALTADSLAGSVLFGEEALQFAAALVDALIPDDDDDDKVKTQYYGIELNVISEIADFAQDIVYLGDSIGKKDNSWRKRSKDIAISLLEMAGVPAGGVTRDFEGILRKAFPEGKYALDNFWRELKKADLAKVPDAERAAAISVLIGNRVEISDEAAAELARLYGADYKKAVPAALPTKYTVDGEEKTLNTTQLDAYKDAWGGAVAGQLEKLIKSPAYVAADDAGRETMINMLYDYAGGLAKEAAVDVAPADWVSQSRDLIDSGKMSLTDIIAYRAAGGKLDSAIKYMDEGMSAEGAITAAGVLGELEPEDGKSQVSNGQKLMALGTELSDQKDKDAAAHKILSSESAVAKYDKAMKAGLTTYEYGACLSAIGGVEPHEGRQEANQWQKVMALDDALTNESDVRAAAKIIILDGGAAKAYDDAMKAGFSSHEYAEMMDGFTIVEPHEGKSEASYDQKLRVISQKISPHRQIDAARAITEDDKAKANLDKAVDAGVSLNTYADWQEACNITYEHNDKDANGESIDDSRRDHLFDWLRDRSDLTPAQKTALAETKYAASTVEKERLW